MPMALKQPCYKSNRHFPLTTSQKEISIVGKSNMRILLIWALFDNTVPGDECMPTYYQAFKENPESRFVILNNTRHMFYMEREEDTCKIITNFLKDTNGGTILERFERTTAGVSKQQPKKHLMTGTDQQKWNFFNEHQAFKQLII